RNELGGKIAQVLVQGVAVADVVEQILPVGSTDAAISLAGSAVALTPCFRTLWGPRVVKIANEQLDHVVNELARFRGGNAGQLFELDLSRLTTMPAIGLFGVGMDTRDDELLTVAQEFDLLWLRVSLYVRSDEIDRDLVERLFGSKKDSAFGRQA